VEPVFGLIKEVMGFPALQLKGHAKIACKQAPTSIT